MEFAPFVALLVKFLNDDSSMRNIINKFRLVIGSNILRNGSSWRIEINALNLSVMALNL